MDNQKLPPSNDEPIGVPPSEFHSERSEVPFKKRGSVQNAILLGMLIIVVDVCIYFFLIKPDDSHLYKALEPLNPGAASPAPSTSIPKPSWQTVQLSPPISTAKQPKEQVMCTMDAQQCPDGSYVGRSGSNCEFVCPK